MGAIVKKGQETKAKLIEEAHRLAVRQGFKRTSVSDVLDAAHATKGSFYHHFADKDALGLAVLERDRTKFLRMLDESLASAAPMQAIENFFDRSFRTHAARGFVGGCLWGSTAIEASDTHPAFAGFVAGVFSAWSAKIETVMRVGQERGEIRGDISAEALAQCVIAVVEGGIMLSRLTKGEEPMRQCLAAMRTMLAPAGAPAPTGVRP